VEERTRELKVTEERFRLLSSASPIGIVLTDASGNCLYVNRRWEDLSGILHDSCLDKGWLNCIHREDREVMLDKWKQSIGESNEHVTEFRVEQEDKPISWLHSRVTSIGDSEGVSRGYIWTFEDITERKNAEANLLMQYAITDALAESSDLSDASPKLLKAICTNRGWSLAILWMLDGQDDVLRYEGSWCADDPSLKNLVENSRRMTFGRGEGALGIPLVSGQPFIAQTADESGLNARMESPPERFGYMSFPVTEDEQVFGVLEFMSDEPIKADGEFFLMLNSVATQINQFAEQMSAEMRLKDSDARIRAMLESAIDGIVTFDLSGVVELVNPAFERILGFDADDVLGKPISQIVPGETKVDRIGDRKISTIQDVLDDLKAHNYSDRELVVRRSDGSLIPVEFRVSEVVLGTRNFYSGIIRDITERKEVELRVSEFYSTVSHELRTPLTSIRGALGLMEGGIVGEIPAEALELVTIARVSCDRLIRLINDILDLRKIEAGKLELKLESLDSETMVRATADSLRTMCEEYGVSIAVHVDDRRPVKGDHDRVVQILTNLVSNAVKFSGPEGKLDVRVVGGHQWCSALRSGGQWSGHSRESNAPIIWKVPAVGLIRHPGSRWDRSRSGNFKGSGGKTQRAYRSQECREEGLYILVRNSCRRRRQIKLTKNRHHLYLEAVYLMEGRTGRPFCRTFDLLVTVRRHFLSWRRQVQSDVRGTRARSLPVPSLLRRACPRENDSEKDRAWLDANRVHDL
jgi:PAS domain S-box-containing protein